MAPDPRPPFPTYLLPSIAFPFRRRQSSTSSLSPPSLSSSPTSSTSTTPGSSPPSAHFTLPSSPAKSLLAALSRIPENRQDEERRLKRAQPNTLRCSTCATDIALASQIVSKGFTGRHGRAYLVSPTPTKSSAATKNKKPTDLVNTKVGRSVNRELLTGQHVVADVSCTICSTVLGWKYVDAKEAAQRYKIGKYILEMKRVVLAVSWEDEVVGEGDEELERADAIPGEEDDGIIVFDSEDEDECEDLFAGTWDPEVVAKRRGRRVAPKKKES